MVSKTTRNGRSAVIPCRTSSRTHPKYLPKGYSRLYAMRMPYDTHEEYAKAMDYNKKHAGFSAAITQNNRELAAVLPVLQGKIMNFTEARRKQMQPELFYRRMP